MSARNLRLLTSEGELSAQCGGKTRIENRRGRFQWPALRLRVIIMATIEASFLHGQLEERKRRLEVAVASAPKNSGLAGLLREVDRR